MIKIDYKSNILVAMLFSRQTPCISIISFGWNCKPFYGLPQYTTRPAAHLKQTGFESSLNLRTVVLTCFIKIIVIRSVRVELLALLKFSGLSGFYLGTHASENDDNILIIKVYSQFKHLIDLGNLNSKKNKYFSSIHPCLRRTQYSFPGYYKADSVLKTASVYNYRGVEPRKEQDRNIRLKTLILLS